MLDLLMLTPAELVTQSGVLIAFATAVLIIALSYMAGEFFSMPSLKAFSKGEVIELGVSAFILLLAMALIVQDGPFDKIAQGFMLPNVPVDQDHICKDWALAHGTFDATGHWTRTDGNIAYAQAGYFLGCPPKLDAFYQYYTTVIPVAGAYSFADIWNNFFDGVMTKKLATGYGSLMLTEMFTGLLSGFYTGLHLPVFDVIAVDLGLNPWISLSPLNQFHTILVDLLGNTYGAFVGQKMLLDFGEEAMLPVFLPFGILLRVFPFTRKTGSTIIAVVFAVYFIYPISILINQQILQMIVYPPPTPNYPNCADITHACSKNSDCCTFDCRAGECVSPLTDFSEYRSIYAICQEKPEDGTNLKAIKDKADFVLGTIADDQNKQLENTYFSGTASTSPWTKTNARLKEGEQELLRKGVEAGKFFTYGMLLPMPGAATQVVFNAIEVMAVQVAQFALLAVVFIVLEIVITMTLFKDFALMIGGEPRLFGLSKLV
ncbi:Uncharacterised protein [uncultured archaeon]|nr:Uncharacterised protein [uncultured archaeon]